ncbi:MAG: MotA/TolQ/ExbB proton channel family protein [Candidatus Thiodiazotropha sp. (ex Rostrolucina anterorostrata)]|nr:MotA/TolQ/ExbB proton channel family protein [Candidatus Thiodiazotropha sp. (ex Rostrolucina anterorostrata)]
MRALLLGFGLFFSVIQLPNAYAAQSDPLQMLLQQVRESRQAEKKRDQARVERFLALHSERATQLKAIKEKLEAAMQHQQALQSTYDQQQVELTAQRQQLEEKTGTFGELFGVVRQVASENLNLFKNDLTSANRQNDLTVLQEIAASRSLPSIERLETLWEIFLQRTVASGQIWQETLPVIRTSGEEFQEQVTVIGLFNAISDGRYLRYLPDTARLVELGRQPAPRFQLMAKNMQQSDEALVRVAVDPSRGAILSLLVQSPTFVERIKQGGYIGYVILVLGLLGFFVVIERLLKLSLLSRRVRKQQGQSEPSEDNPLGRLLVIDAQHKTLSPDALQMHLDEAILGEIPAIRRGLRLLAIFAAVAPLLGLLGTVTGMIETFQSITLFGTGDPKLMSGGISQALVTTELGLAVAIPLVLLHSYLSGRSNRLVQLMDQQSAALVAARAGV